MGEKAEGEGAFRWVERWTPDGIVREKILTPTAAPDGFVEVTGPHADEIAGRISEALDAKNRASEVASKLLPWIEHALAENAGHVSIPVDVTRVIHAILLGVAGPCRCYVPADPRAATHGRCRACNLHWYAHSQEALDASAFSQVQILSRSARETRPCE